MIVTVVGARPQFVKAAVVSRAFAAIGIPETIVHTGQHYDARMSDVFWTELGLPPVSVNLGVGSMPPATQTGRMMELIEACLLRMREEVRGVLVYGDTNSTLAAAIAAAKQGIPLYHVEAGLRSHNWAMPEELNRVLTDRMSQALFCPNASAVATLAREGIREHVYDVGDVMYDALRCFEPASRNVNADEHLALPDGEFALLTLHRAANADSPERIARILDGVATIGIPVLWPVHPRVRANSGALAIPGNVMVCEPLSYLETLHVLTRACVVLTDSGGLQKEAYWTRTRCITLRAETEWSETLEGSWNQLVDDDPHAIEDAFRRAPTHEWSPLYGDGTAATRVAEIVRRLAYA